MIMPAIFSKKLHDSLRETSIQNENGHDAGRPQAYKMKMPEAFSY
jgi:hypothetical protein